ncbi:hypothetical protein B484DRAFT_456970 [Ochromonadaceae sp. CCMP2298]|nr:hypothetical protein B484DRAFT_456970 [Ochromonadaceae sp. CCMP2298]
MYSQEEVIDFLLKAQAVIIFCYLICAMVMSGNTYSGFNAVFLGIVFVCFTAASYYGLKVHVSRTHYGMLLGAAGVLLFTSLESAIYWGQYGDCEKGSYGGRGTGPECSNRPAMKALCAFSVFMFLSYVGLAGALVYFKEELLGAAPLREGYSSVPSFNPHPMPPPEEDEDPRGPSLDRYNAADV